MLCRTFVSTGNSLGKEGCTKNTPEWSIMVDHDDGGGGSVKGSMEDPPSAGKSCIRPRASTWNIFPYHPR